MDNNNLNEKNLKKARLLCLISIICTYAIPPILFLINFVFLRNVTYLDITTTPLIIVSIIGKLFFISIIFGYCLVIYTKHKHHNSKFAKILFIIDTSIIALILTFWYLLYLGMSNLTF